MKLIQIILCSGLFLFLMPSVNAQKDSTTEELNQTNDWPDLRRYRTANAQLNSVQPNEDRVVFMGNSITDGWIKVSPEFFESKPYIDRGISGQTTPQMLLRFRQDVINLHPKVVIILAGINDSFPWRANIEPVQKIITLNKWIRNFSRKNHFVYVDYYSAMADERKGLPEQYSTDGVHPNAAGYKIMEPLAVAGIAKALGKK